MLLVENYYAHKEFLKPFIPYNIMMQTGPTVNTYSIYNVDRHDLFEMALIHNFTVETFIASNSFHDLIKLEVSKRIRDFIIEESSILKLYTTVTH
jgi:hypothetical protein